LTPCGGRGALSYRERAREALARFKDLKDIIALLGVEELGANDRLIVKRAAGSSVSSANLSP